MIDTMSLVGSIAYIWKYHHAIFIYIAFPYVGFFMLQFICLTVFSKKITKCVSNNISITSMCLKLYRWGRSQRQPWRCRRHTGWLTWHPFSENMAVQDVGHNRANGCSSNSIGRGGTASCGRGLETYIWRGLERWIGLVR
jgi:hypothetical protein